MEPRSLTPFASCFLPLHTLQTVPHLLVCPKTPNVPHSFGSLHLSLDKVRTVNSAQLSGHQAAWHVFSSFWKETASPAGCSRWPGSFSDHTSTSSLPSYLSASLRNKGIGMFSIGLGSASSLSCPWQRCVLRVLKVWSSPHWRELLTWWSFIAAPGCYIASDGSTDGEYLGWVHEHHIWECDQYYYRSGSITSKYVL